MPIALHITSQKMEVHNQLPVEQHCQHTNTCHSLCWGGAKLSALFRQINQTCWGGAKLSALFRQINQTSPSCACYVKLQRPRLLLTSPF